MEKLKKRIEILLNQVKPAPTTRQGKKEETTTRQGKKEEVPFKKIMLTLSLFLSPYILKKKEYSKILKFLFFLFKMKNNQRDFQKFLRMMIRILHLPNTLNVLIRFLPSLMKKQHEGIHHFNMIEILIGVSIMVTFSSMIGVVYHKKLEESKESFTKIELNLMNQSLLLFESRMDTYPVHLMELVESGDLSNLRKDPWGNDYLYIPKIDWIQVLEWLKEGGATLGKENQHHWIEKIQGISDTLSNKNITGIEPLKLLAMSNKQGFIFSLGNKSGPIFPPSTVEEESVMGNEEMKMVANLIKSCREKVIGQLILQESLDNLINY
jgi:hypothetical protein